jgi:hypothetical protein
MSNLSPNLLRACFVLLAFAVLIGGAATFATETANTTDTVALAGEATAEADLVLEAAPPAIALADDAPGLNLVPNLFAETSGLGCGTAGATKNSLSCTDCDSQQGYCTPGAGWARCANFCGGSGFCHQECNCCVCPE